MNLLLDSLIQVLINHGSTHESIEVHGIQHEIQHMVFKSMDVLISR
jgi:predicted Zn-dependent peptidase